MYWLPSFGHNTIQKKVAEKKTRKRKRRRKSSEALCCSGRNLAPPMRALSPPYAYSIQKLNGKLFELRTVRHVFYLPIGPQSVPVYLAMLRLIFKIDPVSIP